jgi:hypothetical protein
MRKLQDHNSNSSCANGSRSVYIVTDNVSMFEAPNQTGNDGVSLNSLMRFLSTEIRPQIVRIGISLSGPRFRYDHIWWSTGINPKLAICWRDITLPSSILEISVAVSIEGQIHYPSEHVEGLEVLIRGIEGWKIKVDSQDTHEKMVCIGRRECISDHIHQLSGTDQSLINPITTPASSKLMLFHMGSTDGNTVTRTVILFRRRRI